MAAPQSDMDKLVGALGILRENLEPKVNADEIGTASMTPLKAIVVREALLWRIVELADATIASLNADNALGGIILARASIECAAVQHQLNLIIADAGSMDSKEIDAAIMRLLMGTRAFSTGNAAEDAAIQMTNILTCLKRLDKTFPGILSHYETLCEYAHPNWAGTTGLFSKGDAREGKIILERYVDDTQACLHREAVSSTMSAIMIFSNDYTAIVDHLPAFFASCDRL